jgi:hypothetical protein
MLYELQTTEYLFWLVALGFYLLDNIKLVKKSQLLITETITGKFKPSFSFNTFEIKGQQVQLLNLILPFTGFLKLSTVPTQDPSVNSIQTKDELLALQRNVFLFKTISLISFLYLLSGPFLTFYVGLGATLMVLLPIHLSVLLMTLLLLLLKRNSLDLSYGKLSAIFFDCLVVPAYLPNIVRKIYNKRSFNCDGYYFSLKTSSSKDMEETQYNISRKINQLIMDEDSELTTEKYRLYEISLGIKNDNQ